MNSRWTILAVGVAAVMIGCASTTETASEKSVSKRVDEESKKEVPTQNMGELAARGFEAWSKGAGLNSDQKSKLFVVHTNTATQAFRIRDEISKTKSAMYKELAKGQYNSKMVEGYKNKIIALDQERLDIMIKALASVEAALGRGDEARKYYEYLDQIETQYFREH
jgi:hypothetical protein